MNDPHDLSPHPLAEPTRPHPPGLPPDGARAPMRLRPLRSARRYDLRNFHVTLKQWRALHAVVECGGFCEAAQSLHLSQSSVSYAVGRLQEQFGITLLRVSGRKAELTEQGRALLERSRHLLCEAMELEQFADRLRRGAQAPVRLAVDPDFPPGLLLRAQHRLAEQGVDIALTSQETIAERTEEALRCRRVDLAVTQRICNHFEQVALLHVEYVAVAHPQQRLHRLQRPLHANDLETELEILLARPGDTQAGEHCLQSVRQPRWQVGSADNAIDALREGVGYAWLPRHLVQPWLERGALALLPLSQPSSSQSQSQSPSPSASPSASPSSASLSSASRSPMPVSPLAPLPSRSGSGRIVRLFLAFACPPLPGSRIRLLADMLRSLAAGAPVAVLQTAAS